MKRQLTSDEIKQIELEILIEFSNFCRKNNLRFYLAYGTLLGAVRHKGFIPWDDDIDVIVPRPDYEKFIQIYKSTNENYLLRSNRLNNFSAPFTKLVDVSTIVDNKVTDETNDIDRNLCIDIFPVDGIPDDVQEAKRVYTRARFYLYIHNFTYTLLGTGRTTFRKYAKYILKFVARLYGKNRAAKNIEKIALKNNYEYSNKCGMVVWSYEGMVDVLDRRDFEQATELEFEGHKFPVIKDYDKYLTMIYGDYMQLPPVEERRTHNMIAYKIRSLM